MQGLGRLLLERCRELFLNAGQKIGGGGVLE
uniref:Uncharacterized protein n=1 Tax=Myoviridae sp. ct4tH12 TaxID=2825031 RepID=A0A8S5PY73_9CAUD|nr:MAG TPA: hypothetical protein [Myoviridae sp. ct4tH12]